ESLKELKTLSINDLNKVRGVGLDKALIVKAAFELGERIHSGIVDAKIQITSPKDVAEFMMVKMEHVKHEKFLVMILSSNNILIKKKPLFVGTLNSSIVHT